MAMPNTADLDDADEGVGDDSAYDGLAVEHLNSAEGRAEIAEHVPSADDDEVTV